MAKSVVVVGAGTMGTGIAYVFAAASWHTTVVEPDPGRREQLRFDLRDAVLSGVRRGKLTPETASVLPDSVLCVADLSEAQDAPELIIESVPERFEVKRQVLAAADVAAPAVLATNTSSLSIDVLAESLRYPEAFLGMHFFNPVWSLHLVEVVVGTRTASRTVERAVDIVASIGKEVAIVRDSPGFATSRLDLVAALEAMRMVEEGVASAEHIDRAMRVAYRHPVGPLRLSDIVGLDVRLDIARELSRTLGPHFAPPPILVEMVESGCLGRKSGRGFYEWPDAKT